jgi:hypothetical protein
MAAYEFGAAICGWRSACLPALIFILRIEWKFKGESGTIDDSYFAKPRVGEDFETHR